MYGWDPNLSEHFNLSAALIDNLEPEEDAVLLNIGSYAKDWFICENGEGDRFVAKNGVTVHVSKITPKLDDKIRVKEGDQRGAPETGTDRQEARDSDVRPFNNIPSYTEAAE